MTDQGSSALLLGWTGSGLFIVTWLMISRISALSFPLWIGMMSLATAFCFYAGVRRSKWFFLPSVVSVTVMVGVLVALYGKG